MNVNLGTAIDRHSLNSHPLGNSPSIYDQLRNSAQVLAEHDDTRPVGPPVLIPADQSEAPGAFQAWYPTEDGWVWVDHEGQIISLDFLPLAEDMVQSW